MRAIVLLSVLALGCGGPAVNYQSRAPASAAAEGEAPALDMAARSPSVTPAESGAAGTSAPPSAGALERKIIYEADIDLVVEDFTPVPALVDQLVKGYNGFIANSQVSGDAGEQRTGVWKLRIPIANFDAFLRDAQGNIGEVSRISRDSKDVSEEFYDVEARIRNKRQEETRLLKLLDERTGTLEDVLGIERELSRVREEIERMEGRMRVLADLTSMTTVTLRVREVQHFIPEEATTFGDRVRRAFSNSLWAMRTGGESFLVMLAGAAPWIALLAIPVAVAIRIVRRKLFA